MEYFQRIQKRAAETAAVIKQVIPGLALGGVGGVSGVGAEELLALADHLDRLAQARDDALAAEDMAARAEKQGWLTLKALTLALPRVASGELDARVASDAALLELLAPVFALSPRTSERTLERARNLIAALERINADRAAATPPRAAIESAGQGVAELAALLAAQSDLAQARAARASAVRAARTALRTAALQLDALNKRFYDKLKAEARSNPRLADGLAQITTMSAGLPATLIIRSAVAGGADNRQVLVSYASASFDPAATNRLEWRLAVSPQAASHRGPFTDSVTADPAGNRLGPFAAGQTVQLRSRVSKRGGTTTSRVRTITL